MTQHDTWVTLKPNNPLSGIMHLFSDSQIPMRDPFPMGTGETRNDEAVALMVIDLDRLSSIQVTELLKLYSDRLNTSHDEIFQQSLVARGFPINHEYVDQMFCGPEGVQRSKELADFLENNEPSPEALAEFYNDQVARWIDGDEQPPPLPGHIEGFDPRLRTPELEESLKQQEIEQELAGYSVFDVLTGRAMVDILNKQNPDVHYELVGLEEMLEDE